MDYSKFSTEDLLALEANDLSRVSTKGLKLLQDQLQPTPTKEGFFPSLGAGVKEAFTTLPAAAKLMYAPESKEAAEELIAAQKKAQEGLKQYSFSDVVGKAKAGNYGEALSDLGSFVKQVGGQSIGFQAPAAAAGLTGLAVAGPVGGAVAYGGTLLGEYIASNLGRQLEENEGKPVDRLNASVAAAGQTALDVLQFGKVFPGLGRLVGLKGAKAAEEATTELKAFAQNPMSYKKAVASGAAKGIAFEVPQEVAQQVLERWQAGLEVDPFKDPNAAKEYMESAAGALFLGGPMGAANKVMHVRSLRQQLETTPEIVDKESEALQKELETAFGTPEVRERAEELRAATPTLDEQTALQMAAKQLTEQTAPEGVAKPEAVEVAPSKEMQAADEATAKEMRAAGIFARPEEAYNTEVRNLANELWNSGRFINKEEALKFAKTKVDEDEAAYQEYIKSRPRLELTPPTPSATPERPEFALTAPQAPDLRQMELPLEERVAAPEVSPDQLKLPFDQGAVNAQPAGVSGVGGDTTSAAAPVQTRAAEQPAVEPVVPEGMGSAVAAAGPVDAGKVGEQGALTEEKEIVSKEELNALKKSLAANKQLRAAQKAFDKADNTLAVDDPKLIEARGKLKKAEENANAASDAVNNIFKQQEARAEAPPEEIPQSPPEVKKQARQILKDAGVTDPTEVKAALANYTDDAGYIDLPALQAAYPAVKAKGLREKQKLTKQEIKEAEAISDEEMPEVGKKEEGEPKDLLFAEKETAVQKADSAFDGFRTAQAALRHIIKTGNAFEALVAARLLPNVINVRIQVIQPNQAVPDFIKDKFDTARGLYYEVPETGVKTIYLHGSKFGADVQGVNNTTALHEILHAATAFKIKVGLSRVGGDTAASRVAADMQALMQYAAVSYAKAGANLGIPDIAFKDVREFVTYGMTDPRMQKFLAGVKGARESAFSRFVTYVRNLFNLGPETHTAMSNLVSMVDQIISARLTPAEVRIGKRLGPMKIEAAKVETLAQDAEKEVKEVTTAPEKISLLNEALKVRDFGQFKELLDSVIKGTSSELRPKFLSMLGMHELETLMRDNAKNAGFDKTATTEFNNNLDALMENVRRIGGAKNIALDADGKLINRLYAFQKKDKVKASRMMKLAHISTVNEVDPSKPEVRAKSPQLKEMWDALGPEGQKLFEEMRDNYKAKMLKFFELQRNIIEQSGFSDDSKAKALKEIKAQETKMLKHGPYFPLMRFGRYWVRVDETDNEPQQFYMFESAIARNIFEKRLKKELGDKRDVHSGDGYIDAIKSSKAPTTQLNELKKAIDSGKFTTAEDKQSLKDAVEQMWFAAMPERSFRKQFIHRKNVPGFSGDAIRSFANLSVRTANQFARMEYGNTVLRLADELKNKVKYAENRTVLDAYADEMRYHAANVVNPKDTDNAGNALAGMFKHISFLWYLTSPASAVVNFASIPTFVMPVLQTRFNSSMPETWATVMGNAKNVFSKAGVKAKDGKFTAPSLRESLTDDEKRAFDDALAQEVFSSTTTADMSGLRETAAGAEPNIVRTITNGMAYMFQASERIMREITFVSAYQMARKQNNNHEAAVRRAIEATHESLGDFNISTRARALKSPVMQVAFQFKQFSKFVTLFLVRNTMEMFKGESSQVRKDAITRLIGALGMTGLAAGVTGLPLYSALMGAISLAYNMYKDDDEPPIDADMEFRKWLFEMTNSEWLTRAVTSGPLSVATDVDLHSRLSLNDLWFRDPREAKDEEEAARNFIIQMLGPSVGLGLNVARGIKLMNDGNVERGWEALMPAALRNVFVGARYGMEGAKTLRGDELLAPEAITAGDVAWQMFGFSPSRLADLQQANVKAVGMVVKIQREKTDLLKALDDKLSDGDAEGFAKIMGKVADFNSKYPAIAIEGETIIKSIKAREKAKAQAVSGARIPPKLAPMVEPYRAYAIPTQ